MGRPGIRCDKGIAERCGFECLFGACRAGLVTVLLAVGATLIYSTSQLGQ